jgi:glycosyltransferase involved in cell wall biosynthesis
MSLRIAVMLNASWNIVNFRLGLLRALERDGHHIIVMAPRDKFSEQIPFEFHELPMKADGMNPAHELALLGRMIRLYRNTSPDVTLQFTPKPNIYGSLAARVLGIPAISNVAGLGSMFNRNKTTRWFFMNLYRMALKSNPRVFFQNEEDLRFFVSKGLVKSRSASRLPGSGIDLARFVPRPNDSKKTELRFLLLSRLLWEKGVGDFAEAARQARAIGFPAKFQIVGFLDSQNPGAVPREQVEGWVSEGLLEYLGPRDDVRDAIADADCVVLPSFYREGVPRTLLEASAMGKPIIAYDNVGVKDVVDHGRNGFLVPSRDIGALVQAFRTFTAMSRSDRELMGRLGREKVEREFDESLVVRAYRTALEALDSLPSRAMAPVSAV